MNQIITNLPNEVYHHSPEYYDYWSSTGLRNYLKSPAEAKRIHDEHVVTPFTPAMALGSLVHDALEYVHNTGDFSLSSFVSKLSVFQPPVNEKTGAVYGSTTKRYTEAYQDFISSLDGKQPVMQEDIIVLHSIMRNVEQDSLMSRMIIQGQAEASHFIEHNGAKYKIRPDLLLKKALFDYKTINGPLDAANLQRRVLDSGYHIQLAMYQWVIHEETGEWKSPYIFFMQTCAPYDVLVVNLSDFCYSEFNSDTIGAKQFEAIRDLHEHCLAENYWPNPSIFVKPDDSGRRILDLECPSWANKTIITPYYN